MTFLVACLVIWVVASIFVGLGWSLLLSSGAWGAALMRPAMARLLLAHRVQEELRLIHETDARAKAASDEARARRELGLEHRGFPLRTRRSI